MRVAQEVVRVANDAAISGFVLSNLLDAGLESINKALKLPVGKQTLQ